MMAAGGYRPGAGRPPTKDPQRHAEYLKAQASRRAARDAAKAARAAIPEIVDGLARALDRLEAELAAARALMNSLPKGV